MRAVVLFIALATLSACQAESALQREEKVQVEAAALTGWDRLFGSPATTIASANQFGFRAGPYVPAGSIVQSRSAAPIMIGSSTAAKPSTAAFVASGTDIKAIERIAFMIDVTDPDSADIAKDRFSTLIRDFLFQAKADGFVPVGSAIAAEQDGSGTVPGAAWTLTRRPLAGAGNDARRIIMTFTRPDTKSATSSS